MLLFVSSSSVLVVVSSRVLLSFFRRLPCSIGSAEVESWILLFFCFFWALSSGYYCCETIDWLLSGVEGVASLGGIVLIDFLWRRALRKKFSSLFCRKETKQASKGSSCGSVSQVFFFFSPTVCFFSGRTFCLASLWRSCFSVRQWLGNRGMLMTARSIVWLIDLKSVVVSRHRPNDSPLVCCGLFWNSFGETGRGSFCSDMLYVWHVALSLTTESSGEVWIGSQYTLIYFYVFSMYFVCPVLLHWALLHSIQAFESVHCFLFGDFGCWSYWLLYRVSGRDSSMCFCLNPVISSQLSLLETWLIQWDIHFRKKKKIIFV